MEHLIPVLLLMCAGAVSSTDEPLAVVMQRRRLASPIYASEFVDEYEPYAVAAFPLHAPVPVLQLFSPQPYAPKYRKHVKRPQPERDLYAYASDNIENSYQTYAHNQLFSDSLSLPTKYPKQNSFEDDSSSVVVYARPNKNGGFSYRKPSPTPTPAPVRDREREPIIIRIHKYRVIH